MVDDDNNLRTTIRAVLEDDGRTVEDYATCETFLEAYRPGREGCLVIDAYLPGMNGIDLLQRLKTAGHRLPAIMITGDADLKNVFAGAKTTRDGLGLWPDAIIDQHFLQRQRNNRLVSAVLDRPALVGVGIDESTAVVVRGSRFEVIGRSSVIVVSTCPSASNSFRISAAN